DVMTSAPVGGAAAAGAAGLQAASTDDQKLTGQRNENSVLFSLNALTSNTKKEEPSRGQTTATSDGSGLIDIRALSATMGNEGDAKKDKNARVDDIMNLSGGGAFGAALAAPILAPPPLDAPDPAIYGGGYGGEAKSNKTMLMAILGGAAIIAIGIVVAVVLVTKSGTSTTDTSANASSTASAGASPTGATSVAANDTSAASVTAPAPTDNTPPPPGTGNTTTGHGGGAKTGGGGGAIAANTPKPHDDSPKLPDPPKNDPPKDFNSALAAAAGAPANAPAATGGGGGSTAPFDRGAAAGSLGSINVQSCKKGDGPTGSGHVKVTFAPNGSVSAAVVDGGPFPGTPVGGCIAGKFRGAHVPAFAGGAVTVGKSFAVN
ncbi:MAG TPA: hypothetical protein VIF62_22535, partial [Labilithrix sp.]